MTGQRIRADKRISVSESAAAITHAELTGKIIGAAMRVHNQLGPGLKEIHYQRALSLTMTEAGLAFEEERSVEVTLDDAAVGVLFLDHFVEGQVIVELKALSHMLTDEEIAQVITYLAATKASLGLLFNFGRRRLEFRRILPPKKLSEWQARARRYAWLPHDGSNPYPLIRSTSAVGSSANAPNLSATSADERSDHPLIRSASVDDSASPTPASSPVAPGPEALTAPPHPLIRSTSAYDSASPEEART